MNNINSKYTQCPNNFIYMLDGDCLKLFLILSQKESYWRNKGMLDNDYFSLTINEISDNLMLKNKDDVRCVIESLYRNNLIDVICCIVKGRNTPNKFKINWSKVEEYNKLSLHDIIEFKYRIVKLERGTKTTYDKKCNMNNEYEIQDVVQDVVQNVVQNVSTTIDSIDSIKSIDNNTTILRDKNNIKNEIDNIFDIETYFEKHSVPNDMKPFADKLKSKAISFLNKYSFNSELMVYGEEYISDKMKYLTEFIDKFTMLERERNI